ncbi:hypothetical protein ACLOJK_031932 [Asimina triloba]
MGEFPMKSELQLEPTGVNPTDLDPLLENQAEASPVRSDEIRDEEIEAASASCCRICLEYDAEPGDFQEKKKKKGRLIVVVVMNQREEEAEERKANCGDGKGKEEDTKRTVLAMVAVVVDGSALMMIVSKEKKSGDVGRRKRGKKKKRVVAIMLHHDSYDNLNAIAAMGGFAYLMDKNGNFRNSFSEGWDRILSKHPIPFYYCVDPCMAGCRNCCYGWGILDCFPASMELCFALLIVFIVIFAILGIAYGFLAATMAIQRIWQRHYHILTKRELTKASQQLTQWRYYVLLSKSLSLMQEYVVEDLHGCYMPPKLDPEHEERLKMLKLLWLKSLEPRKQFMGQGPSGLLLEFHEVTTSLSSCHGLDGTHATFSMLLWPSPNGACLRNFSVRQECKTSDDWELWVPSFPTCSAFLLDSPVSTTGWRNEKMDRTGIPIRSGHIKSPSLKPAKKRVIFPASG